MLRFFIAIGLFTCINAPIQANPLEGDLFGYRIGDRYPVSERTRGRPGVMGGLELLAEKPTMPVGVKEVRMMVTSKTHTIANIYGTAEFRSLPQAKAFTAKYADLLNTLYGKECTKEEAYLRETVKLLCSGKFILSLTTSTEGKQQQVHTVTVRLTTSDASSVRDDILDRFKREDEELRAEFAKQRLDSATESKQLDGLR
jgi:hypothetical protein